GAIGVTTSRSLNHRAKDGTPAPSVRTAKDEVLALARGLGAAQAGVFQIIPEQSEPPAAEMELVEQIAAVSRRPVSFSLSQHSDLPERWRELVAGMEKANRAGHKIRAQIMARPIGNLMGLDLSLHPFTQKPSYQAIAHLPLAERVRIMRDPSFKAKVLSEQPVPNPQPLINRLLAMTPLMSELGESPEYFPPSETRIGERARALGVEPESLAYDLLLGEDGHAILCLPAANFAEGSPDVAHEMMTHPDAVLGLGDGG